MKTITPAFLLSKFIRECETLCEAQCCGIGAFDFSLLRVTSHLTRVTGDIEQRDIDEFSAELDLLLEETEGVTPDENGLVCCIQGTHQCFRPEELQAFVHGLKEKALMAPQLLKYASELEADVEDEFVRGLPG